MEFSDKSVMRSIGRSLTRPSQLLIFEPMCLLLLLSAVLLGIFDPFFSAFGLVFGDVYGFNLWQTGLAFLGIFVGMLAASATNPIWHSVYQRLLQRNRGIPEPEMWLLPAVIGAVLVPTGLLWFAWTIYLQIRWMVPIVGSGVYGIG